MLNICISAVASNQGKTILTTALLYHFKNLVRPFKIGPDFIDPQFHKMVCQTDSINLDTFMMNEEQIKWLFNKYCKKINILEGVMGFYDGENKGCSSYGVSKILQIPTILILDGSGSYITISAVLKGLKEYRKDNTIKAVVLNRLSSTNHYELIKNQINSDHKNIEVLGWISKNIKSLMGTHLGLDLENLDKIKEISKEVLGNIDLEKLKNLDSNLALTTPHRYPFNRIKKRNKKLVIVNDSNFSFLYYDNLQFLKEIFKKVIIIDSTKDEKIPKDTDVVYICGGYVETSKSYEKIKNSDKFRKSLIKHSKKNKKIYAECAGLLYLSNRVDEKKMSGILDIDFSLGNRFKRLGYYYNQQNIKGHSFHYTFPIDSKNGFDILSKQINGAGDKGSWSRDNILATYLHIMFRNNSEFFKRIFIRKKILFC